MAIAAFKHLLPAAIVALLGGVAIAQAGVAVEQGRLLKNRQGDVFVYGLTPGARVNVGTRWGKRFVGADLCGQMVIKPSKQYPLATIRVEGQDINPAALPISTLATCNEQTRTLSTPQTQHYKTARNWLVLVGMSYKRHAVYYPNRLQARGTTANRCGFLRLPVLPGQPFESVLRLPTVTGRTARFALTDLPQALPPLCRKGVLLIPPNFPPPLAQAIGDTTEDLGFDDAGVDPTDATGDGTTGGSTTGSATGGSTTGGSTGGSTTGSTGGTSGGTTGSSTGSTGGSAGSTTGSTGATGSSSTGSTGGTAGSTTGGGTGSDGSAMSTTGGTGGSTTGSSGGGTTGSSPTGGGSSAPAPTTPSMPEGTTICKAPGGIFAQLTANRSYEMGFDDFSKTFPATANEQGQAFFSATGYPLYFEDSYTNGYIYIKPNDDLVQVFTPATLPSCN